MPRVRKGAPTKETPGPLADTGDKSRHKQQAKVALVRAGQYRDRRNRRREFRRLWITRISAVQDAWDQIQRPINGLSHAGIKLNRKMLSQIAGESSHLRYLGRTSQGCGYCRWVG